MKQFTILLLCFLASSHLTSQDLHWSQQEFGVLQNSPAMIGAFQGSSRYLGQYRSQWRTVPVGFQTFALSYDKKLQNIRGLESVVGFRVASDRVGDAGLSWSQVELLASATRPLSDVWKMSLGLGFSGGQRAFDVQKLSFKSQWNGDIYDENLASGESFNRSSGFVPSIQTGLAFHYKNSDTRTVAHFFGGAYHLNRPKVSFLDAEASDLSLRMTFGGWGVIQLHEKYDIVIGSSFQNQGKYTESLLRSGLRYQLAQNGDNPTFFELGMAYRFGDAFIPSLRFDWNAWSLGFSYDYNTSPFSVATNSRGGFELGLQYRLVPVEPLPVKKICPVF